MFKWLIVVVIVVMLVIVAQAASAAITQSDAIAVMTQTFKDMRLIMQDTFCAMGVVEFCP